MDNYADTFPLKKAMNPTTLIAYEMNGSRCQIDTVRPRMLVPGYFGEKNVKWVTRIEVALDGAKGFYEQQGWGPISLSRFVPASISRKTGCNSRWAKRRTACR